MSHLPVETEAEPAEPCRFVVPAAGAVQHRQAYHFTRQDVAKDSIVRQRHPSDVDHCIERQHVRRVPAAAALTLGPNGPLLVIK